MSEFYQISSKSPNPETPDKNWFAEAKETLLCRQCSSPRLTGKPIDVVLETDPDKSALNFVHGVCVQIASTALITQLFPRHPLGLLLGKVLGPDRGEIAGFKTFMHQNSILIRGDERSTFRVCTVCHRVWYSPVGKRYILKRDAARGNVFESQFGGLVVNADVLNRIVGGKWKNLVIRKLELRDEAVDGLCF